MERHAHRLKKRLIHHYDQDARAYHEVNYGDPGSYSPLEFRHSYIEDMIEHASLPREARILDAGCGPGELVLSLTKKGYDVWGVDISEGMIDKARDVLKSGGFRLTDRLSVGDIEDIRFDDGFFDVVVASGVIEYQQDDHKALSEMKRVLGSGGYLILNVTNRYADIGTFEGLYRWSKKWGATRRVVGFVKERVLRKGKLHNFPDRRTHSPLQFNRTFAKYGFQKVSHNYFHFSLLPTPLDSVFSTVCKPVGKWMERFTVSRIAILLAGGYLAMFKKVS